MRMPDGPFCSGRWAGTKLPALANPMVVTPDDAAVTMAVAAIPLTTTIVATHPVTAMIVMVHSVITVIVSSHAVTTVMVAIHISAIVHVAVIHAVVMAGLIMVGATHLSHRGCGAEYQRERCPDGQREVGSSHGLS